MSSAAASVQDPSSAFQSLEPGTPDESGGPTSLPELIYFIICWVRRTWLKLPRIARILLTGLMITSCSFSLSMIVCILSH